MGSKIESRQVMERKINDLEEKVGTTNCWLNFMNKEVIGCILPLKISAKCRCVCIYKYDPWDPRMFTYNQICLSINSQFIHPMDLG